MQAAKSMAVRLSVTLTLRQGRCASRKTNRLTVPLRLYFIIVAPALAWLGRDRLAHLANELGGALIKADHRTLWIGGFGIEVEDILHARNVFAVYLWNAPHLLAPGFELIFGQSPTHRFAGDAGVLGEPHQFIGQQLQRPTSAPSRWTRTGGRHQ